MHRRGISYAVAAAFMFGLGAVLAQLVGLAMDAAIVALFALLGGGLLLSACLALAGTLLSARDMASEHKFIELEVRANTGLGAEKASTH